MIQIGPSWARLAQVVDRFRLGQIGSHRFRSVQIGPDRLRWGQNCYDVTSLRSFGHVMLDSGMHHVSLCHVAAPLWALPIRVALPTRPARYNRFVMAS